MDILRNIIKEYGGGDEETPLLSKGDIEYYFVRCEFDDECDLCDNPEHGSYAVWYVDDERGMEVDGYICGRCASIVIPNIDYKDLNLRSCAKCKFMSWEGASSMQPFVSVWCAKGKWDGVSDYDTLYKAVDCDEYSVG